MEVNAMGNRVIAAATVIILGLGALAWSQTSTDSSNTHTRWEYKYVKMETAEIEGTSDGEEYTVVKLDQLGNDGWELVSMLPHKPFHERTTIDSGPSGRKTTDFNYFDCYFKRPR
jgi:uncharacterized protein DUF4177